MSTVLGRLSAWRHVPVVVTVAVLVALAGCGVIAADRPERFDTWQVVIEPWPQRGPDALRVTETFDQDFGSNDRHGPERYLPADEFGVPIDVEASSPDAPDDVSTLHMGSELRIRIGDPAVTISGQHRYTLAYTYPEAMLERGFLAIDALDGDRFETDHAEVIVRGFELAEPRCFAGPIGSTDRCELTVEDGRYRAVFEPLPPHTAVTIDGRIVGRIPPVEVPDPPIPPRRGSDRLQAMGIMAGLGVAGAGAVFLRARRRGRNEVYAGGAPDAAFGPGGTADDAPVRLVADADMDELATIEFASPEGITPWEGRVLLTEQIDEETVAAWFAGMAGRGAIDMSESGNRLRLERGQAYDRIDGDDALLLRKVFGNHDRVELGRRYDAVFAAAWSAIRGMQRGRIKSSGWWKRLPPSNRAGSMPWLGWVVLIACTAPWIIALFTLLLGLFGTWWGAAPLGVLLPAAVAWIAYRGLLPARSAEGSALALRTESFRRFLHASEGQHVQWAWERGVLREYSGWAVALGEADAWGSALLRANIPPQATFDASPLIMPRHAPAIRASHTAPASSGSSGGSSSSSSSSSSSFSGGSSGGGGGGGSRGSW